MGFGNLEPGTGILGLRFSSEDTEPIAVVLVTSLVHLHGYSRTAAAVRLCLVMWHIFLKKWESTEVSTAALCEGLSCDQGRPRLSLRAASGSDLGLTLWSFLELPELWNKNTSWKERNHCLRKVMPNLNSIKSDFSCSVHFSGAHCLWVLHMLTINTKFLWHGSTSVKLDVLLWFWTRLQGPTWVLLLVPVSHLAEDQLQLSRSHAPLWILSSRLLRWLLCPGLSCHFCAVERSCLPPSINCTLTIASSARML